MDLIWRSERKIKFGADLIWAIFAILRQFRQIFSAPKFIQKGNQKEYLDLFYPDHTPLILL